MLLFISHSPLPSPSSSAVRIAPRIPVFLKSSYQRQRCFLLRMSDSDQAAYLTAKSLQVETTHAHPARTEEEKESDYQNHHHHHHQGGDDDDDNGNNGGDDSGNRDDDDDDDDDEDDAHGIVGTSAPITQDPISNPTPSPILNTLLVEFPEVVHAQITLWAHKVGSVFGFLFKNVPPQVLVAFLGIITAFLGRRNREKKEKVSKEELKRRAVEQSRAEEIAKIRSNYQSLEGVLLRSAVLLSNRLYDIVEGSATVSPDSAKYTTYLIAKYFASVELFKKQSDALNLGFPAADRIFSNILMRNQGIWAADNDALLTIQKSERLFKPAEGQPLVNSGPLQILPVTQISLGNILLRSYWVKKKRSKLLCSEESSVRESSPSIRAIISYVEFCDLLDTDPVMQKWTRPVEKALRVIEKRRRRNMAEKTSVGARIFVVQSSLIDLVNFLDPGPRARYVPYGARRRLRLGKARIEEDVPIPDSGRGILRALGALRDGMGTQGILEMNKQERERPLEVFVKASEEATGLVLSESWGDCPFSHRVLLMLETMRVPYKTYRIRHDEKPSWFHIINTHGKTPVIYHEGHLVSDSNTILEYLSERFENKSVPKQTVLPLAVSCARLTRFHDVFMSWLMKCSGGDNMCSRRALAELEREMRLLNGILSRVKSLHAQQDRSGGIFFGGTKFSREDITLIPFLHHVVVAGKELKSWNLGKDCEAVAEYLKHASEIDSFKKTAADVSAIVAGYGRVLREGKDRELNLAVELQ